VQVPKLGRSGKDQVGKMEGLVQRQTGVEGWRGFGGRRRSMNETTWGATKGSDQGPVPRPSRPVEVARKGIALGSGRRESWGETPKNDVVETGRDAEYREVGGMKIEGTKRRLVGYREKCQGAGHRRRGLGLSGIQRSVNVWGRIGFGQGPDHLASKWRRETRCLPSKIDLGRKGGN